MNKITKILSITMMICVLLSFISCEDKEVNKEPDIAYTTVTNTIMLETQNTTKSGDKLEKITTTKKQIIKNDYSYKDVSDLKIKIPKYEMSKKIKSTKYSSDVYIIQPDEVIMGISLYTSNDKYPDNSIYSDYIERDSVNSINSYTVTDTIKKIYNINSENFMVNESSNKENTDVKTKHNVYKFTGYIFTDYFAKNIDNDSQNLIYYYSNAIKIDDKVVVLWVCDLTEDHLYQEECAKILNEIIMEKI